MRCRKRIACARDPAQHELDAIARDELERVHTIAAMLAQQRQQLDRVVRCVNACHRGNASMRSREKLEHSLGDDAERAFGADEEML
jgi:hypothetical protein